MPQAVLLILSAGGALWMAGKGASEAGEGVSQAGNGSLKAAIAAGIVLYIYLKVK